MDSMVHDILDRIATEAGRLARSAKRVTITAWDIQIAVRLLLPGKMGRLVESNGTKAILRYTRSELESFVFENLHDWPLRIMGMMECCLVEQ
ncbi:Histone H2B type W-T [Plecturocebus cupreus]